MGDADFTNKSGNKRGMTPGSRESFFEIRRCQAEVLKNAAERGAKGGQRSTGRSSAKRQAALDAATRIDAFEE